jgi:preprotein translocase subunit YajC
MNYFQIFCGLVFAQGDGAATTTTDTSSPFGGMMLPLMLTMVLFYFMFMMPDRKRQKELEKQLQDLKKNDPVTTAGGICGVVVNISPGSKYVTIRIDESNNTRMKVLRTHITHIGPHEEIEEKDKKDNA